MLDGSAGSRLLRAAIECRRNRVENSGGQTGRPLAVDHRVRVILDTCYLRVPVLSHFAAYEHTARQTTVAVGID